MTLNDVVTGVDAEFQRPHNSSAANNLRQDVKKLDTQLRLKIFNRVAMATGCPQLFTPGSLAASNDRVVVRLRTVADCILRDVEDAQGRPVQVVDPPAAPKRPAPAPPPPALPPLDLVRTRWRGQKDTADFPELPDGYRWFRVQAPAGNFIEPRRVRVQNSFTIPVLADDETFEYSFEGSLHTIKRKE